MIWKILGCLVLLYDGYHTWQSRPVTHGNGVIARDTPVVKKTDIESVRDLLAE